MRRSRVRSPPRASNNLLICLRASSGSQRGIRRDRRCLAAGPSIFEENTDADVIESSLISSRRRARCRAEPRADSRRGLNDCFDWARTYIRRSYLGLLNITIGCSTRSSTTVAMSPRQISTTGPTESKTRPTTAGPGPPSLGGSVELTCPSSPLTTRWFVAGPTIAPSTTYRMAMLRRGLRCRRQWSEQFRPRPA